MTDIIYKIAKRYKLNLIEQCILYDLWEKYPRTVSIKEMASEKDDYQLFMNNMEKLIDKGLVEKRFQKYRLSKV